MSKLLIEMEMPKRCAECDMVQKTKSGYRCPIASKMHGFSCTAGIGQLERPHYCPIDGVLPEEHGDLIDRDALLEKYNVKGTNIAECLTDQTMARSFEKYCIIADAVESAETVIAAERKDDE